MSLRASQSLFARLIAELILWAFENGMEVTLGEAWRTQEQAKLNADNRTGIRDSLHCDRLAVDLNLFIGGVFVDSTEGHRRLGEKWKSMHPRCRWGGDFRKPDGNHYSFTPDGRRA